ncbi:MAG TPA: hypothetical protein VJY62_03770 [Bacteroidia bacterium]|nr:hypothetical protein [Bacteroidia bacterium]
MKIKVTVDIFSGRPNPAVILDGTKAKKIMDQLQPAGRFKTNTDQHAPEPVNLGYRGILIEQISKSATDLPSIIRVTPDRLYAGDKSSSMEDMEFEKNVFDLIRDFDQTGNKKKFKPYLNKEIERFRIEREKLKLIKFPIHKILNICACAPPHDIAWWNDGGTIQHGNNCYNYSTNYRTNTFAQPGRSAGMQYTSLSGCAVAAGQRSAKDGAKADCLIDLPGANNKCPGNGHLVALVVAPDFDYHWYRKGPDGKWSHKPGPTAATLVDNSGNPISDPRTADRGPYTQFCTFMQVIHGHIKIN